MDSLTAANSSSLSYLIVNISNWSPDASVNDINASLINTQHAHNDPHMGTMRVRYTGDEPRNVYLACRAVYFCLLILCTVGNGLNLVVLIRSVPTWKTSACHYMIGTAVADILALWFGLIIFWSDLMLGWSWHHVTTGVAIFLPWFMEASVNLSDWLLVIMNPFRFRFLQRVSVARFVIVVLTVLSMTLHMVYLAAMCCVSSLTEDSSTGLPEHFPEWAMVWNSFNTRAQIAVRILTFLLILVPTIGLIIFLAHHQRSKFGQMRRLQRAAAASASASKSVSQHGINIILLSNAMLFLITRSPKFFDLCVSAAPYDLSISYVTDYTVHNLAQPIIYTVTYMGYSLNFYLYLLTERQYRRRFVELVVRPVLRPWLPVVFANNSSGRTESVELSARTSTQPISP
ncbi:neuromedin-U receptor 1-like isoform X2 [Paramacrobiotus metropolitanus]|uniref:neuromedin-U receptor 1-like isoform X2 n=1 Tax=Paramacrobiotus metropolitanus TaxID=2943436 RepID=UPI0024465C25|nr:neuromedin-U receptor 1-like isoform X2 [Paramacrobiotus metropolitanus]